jgi:hypothetical protein
MQRITVASDCKVVVDAIKQGGASSYGAVIHEISLRSSVFLSCNFLHEFRTSNVEAHSLAKHALTLGDGRHVWLGQTGDLDFVPLTVTPE